MTDESIVKATDPTRPDTPETIDPLARPQVMPGDRPVDWDDPDDDAARQDDAERADQDDMSSGPHSSEHASGDNDPGFDPDSPALEDPQVDPAGPAKAPLGGPIPPKPPLLGE